VANSTAQRPLNGTMRLKAPPATAEDIRKRKVSANRVLAYLKACLNHAYDEGKVPSRSAWDRKLAALRAFRQRLRRPGDPFRSTGPSPRSPPWCRAA
jgi:hypothetical protein